MTIQIGKPLKPMAALACALVSAGSALGASFSANPIADAFVTTGPTANLGGNNYGGAGALSIAAPGSASGEFQSLMRYDLSGALALFDSTFGPGQWFVQSVTLQLTAQTANNPIFNTPAAGQFGVSWMQNDTWTEGSGTPAAPGASGISFNSLVNTFINGSADQALGTFSFNGVTSGTFAYSLNLASGLLGEIQAGDSVSLRLFGADSIMSGVFPARTFGTVASRPLLSIEAVAVPEPQTFTLVAAGIAALAIRQFVSRQGRE